MNENNSINYYAIIPATVRYDSELKSNEKLLYGEVTALSNKYGYCYAQNRYFAELYNVTTGTVSKWFSHLKKLGYIDIELIRNEKQEIIERHIYILDPPYISKKLYPYGLKELYPIVKKDKDNIININKDDLFNLIINNSLEISQDFYLVIKRFGFNYTSKMLSLMRTDKIEMVKEIIYVLYDLYNSSFNYLLTRLNRESLINLYMLSKEHKPFDFLNYYKRAIINKYNTS